MQKKERVQSTMFPAFLYSQILFILLMFPLQFLEANDSDVRLVKLEATLDKKEDFQKDKTGRIEVLRSRLGAATNMGDKRLEYDLNSELYKEYRSFVYDSAFKYVQRMIRLANELGDKRIIYRSKIELGFTFLSSGLFKESLDTLGTISSSDLDIDTRIDYYNVLARTYYDLANYHNSGIYYQHYNRIGNQLLDSALSLLPDTSDQYWLAMGQRRMKAGDFPNAADAYNFVLSQFNISARDYAIATSSLGYIYSMLGRNEDAIDMLIKAAISDIESSTKETVAFRNLAVQLYQKGELDMAYRYIIISLENATFYNARHRKMEIGEVLPIIEGKRVATLEKQRKQLIGYGLATTVLSIIVTLFVIAFYRQLKKLRAIRSILQETNSNLTRMNETLKEANKIKEEYIGYFFNINSEFINRLEEYQKTIKRKITARQFDDLNYIIKSADLHKERENLFVNFDKIFLKLFPHFIEEFNRLFKPEDQVVVGQEELLTADLRIFALIRLGITDSEKIANFLNYSVNTIYTYKTKLKQKAIVPKEDFDDYIMAIKALGPITP